MKKAFFLCMAVAFAACQQEAFTPQSESFMTVTPTEITVGAVWDEQTQSLLQPAVDPYTLENFQIAAAKLRMAPLSATHYAVRVLPRTEAEQRALEADPDLQVAYTPFTYRVLPSDGNQTAARIYEDPAESRRYTEIREGTRMSEGTEVSETIELKMPVLYVVWPVTKPIPVELDTEILYEVYLPNSRLRGVAELEQTALEQVRPAKTSRIVGGQPIKIRAFGSIYTFDTFVQKMAPLGGLKVIFESGSKRIETYTRPDGSFGTVSLVDLIDMSYRVEFQSAQWKICRPGSITPITINLGNCGDKYYSSQDFSVQITSSTNLIETHRAVHFYFTQNGGNYIPHTGNIRINVFPQTDPSASGRFWHYQKKGDCWIEIYDNNYGSHDFVQGTVFHELGHFAQHEMKGYGQYWNTQLLIKESWASYVGWELCGLYYRELQDGSNLRDPNSGQGRQFWYPGCSLQDYSPLFVDLRDNENQHVYGNKYPDDLIFALPYSAMNQLGRDSQTVADFQRLTLSYLHPVEWSAWMPYWANYQGV